ncbi:MAG: cytochrome c [Deltaproteobacteria bacterium]|nr:cytochrome c [Deltaproteobacteria bacterium]
MKRKVSIIILATFLAIFLGNILPMITNSYGGEVDQGKTLFDSKCVICHGANGKGDGPAAAALNPPPRDFSSSQFWQGNMDQEIADTIRNGLSPMPAFDLSDGEIKAIIDYMKHTFKSN